MQLPPSHGPVERRHGYFLPHWTKQGATYAIVFREGDSLPRHILTGWLNERREIMQRAESLGRAMTDHERRRLDELHSERIEAYLDAGHGACTSRDPRAAAIIQNALRFFDGERYELSAWCVMPNHVHAVVRPLGEWTLDKVLHSWKSFTSHQINKLLGRTGPLWQPESYDHLIRDEQDFQHAIEYTCMNPTRAGLKDWPWLGRPGRQDRTD